LEKCPFCKSPVAEDLVRFGGSCPHCFIEIPGEEAPTNPGVEQQQAEAAAEAAAIESANKRSSLGLVVAVLAMLSLGGGAIAWMSGIGSDELAMNDTDEDQFFIIPASEVPEGELPPDEVDAVADASAPPEGSGYTAPAGYVPPAQAQPVRSADDPVQPEHVQSTLAPSAGSSGTSDDLQVMPSFGVTTLSDPDMIRSMIQSVIGRYKGQMKHCYEKSLKANESLRGTWYLTFTIQPSGAVYGVSAVGKTIQDAGLQSCMVGKASDWRFKPVNESQLIQNYPFRFGS